MAVPARWALLIVALQPLADIQPPVNVLDLFAGPRGGGCGVAKACRAENLAALTYDCLHDPINQDVLNPRGLETLILYLLRVKPEGLVVLGPPCSNWIGLSRFRHGRTRLFPRGYTTLPTVRIANAIAEVVAEVLQFCDARGLAYFIEQPSTSVLFHYPAVAAAIAAGLATRVTWHMGAFGFRTPKASTGYCSAWWALIFVERARRLLRRQKELWRKKSKRLYAKHKSKTGRIYYTGNRAMLLATSYPTNFCKALVALHFR